MAFSPDGTKIGITSVAFSPDGTKIVSACTGGTIKVWDLGAQEPSNRTSFAITDVCWLVWQARWSCLARRSTPTATGSGRWRFRRTGPRLCRDRTTRTIKVWDMVNWSRKDHLMFSRTTQRFVLLLLWLNKYTMKFPDDVLDLLIEAGLKSR